MPKKAFTFTGPQQVPYFNKNIESEMIAPEILADAWGRLEVAGQAEPFKDAKLYPGGARPLDWNETGTQHSPDVQPADLKELVEGAQVVALATCSDVRWGLTLGYGVGGGDLVSDDYFQFNTSSL